VLTGFANRARFEDRLETDIARAHRTGGQLAILLIDLDRFVYVNETLGHQAGDAVLQQVARRLQGVVLEGELIARSGADEFIMLADLSAGNRTAADVAAAVNALFARPFVVAGREIFMTASVGVALYPEDGTNTSDLIKKADWALYCAKDAGRNMVQFYARVQARSAPQRLLVEGDLRRALERNQLELHYQPKLHLTSRRVSGVEALLRWRHPERGLIAPDQFIPLAEECGLIVELGRWVTDEACRQAAEWRKQFLHAPSQVAINLSAVQLRRPELADEVLDALARHGLPGPALLVEVTETAVVSDPLLATVTLETLQAHGVRSAIDDFGKGFSSLSQLKRLPIDSLKIDSSFVRDVIVDRESTAIVQAMIGLARNLDMKVVAEGVETPEQLAFLTQHGCDEAQGYLIARPLPPAEVATFLKGGQGMVVPETRPASTPA
jgi:diguanylate cyclase (GGDEF)-like protein